MSPIQRVCVFCGSSAGSADAYARDARRMGALLAERDLTLVYGGGAVGLMGELADAVLAARGRVIGVIPQALVARELAHPRVSDMRVVSDLHARKALMIDLADAFVALPGGLGTLDELLEVATQVQLNVHAKPILLLNTDRYFAKLLEFIAHATREGFVDARYSALFRLCASPEDLVACLHGKTVA